jgi:hypothetical protein
MQAITNALQGLTIGQPQVYQNLSAIPLLLRDAPRANYITLTKAVTGGFASITEISEGGSVPELMLENTGKENVLVLDGEELIGAKQNRIANLTILAAAESKTVIPVSCVEAGRWSYRSENFAVSERAQYSRGRAAKAAALSANMKATGTHGADQNMVWDNIQAKQSRMSVESPTSAMADMYDQHHERVEDYTSQFVAVDNQVGVLFAIDGEVEGMDLFDAADTFAAMLPKLARSFAIDALETSGRETKPLAQNSATQFLDRVAAAHADTYPGVGLGTDVRLSAPLVAGGGLVYDDKLVHLVAFRNGAPGSDASRQRSQVDTRLRSRRYAQMRQRNNNRNGSDSSGGNENGNGDH